MKPLKIRCNKPRNQKYKSYFLTFNNHFFKKNIGLRFLFIFSFLHLEPWSNLSVESYYILIVIEGLQLMFIPANSTLSRPRV